MTNTEWRSKLRGKTNSNSEWNSSSSNKNSRNNGRRLGGGGGGL